ncbi:transglycosylase SLT domain-containing protein [Streptomyces sp. I05A-00742]|uniref:aggregation-promoting factor C-terminal-like domain-containing protein n=1 Tax=Streptomyces sp. I05A-00742 TaxID=2732853 RepID=UPI001488660E|nr:transglycosylase SLT domain-containing protein [Streptomyces sp. I05A-00742]
MLEGKRVSRISVRGFAVASATAVTTVGAVVGVAQGDEQSRTTTGGVEAAAPEATLLADVPAGQSVQGHASLTQQADTQVGVAQTVAKKEAEEAARKQAAEDAAAKKEAVEAAAKKEAEEKAKEKAEKREKEKAEDVASRSATRDASSFPAKGSYSVAEVQSIARQIVPADQFQCFSNIVNNESSWDYTATNASSGAYGLVQALPAEKMSSAGADWRTNPATQIKWGLSYMNERYHSPCGAWSFWQANNWY